MIYIQDEGWAEELKQALASLGEEEEANMRTDNGPEAERLRGEEFEASVRARREEEMRLHGDNRYSRGISHTNVQAFIQNNSFPKDLDNLLDIRTDDYDSRLNLEKILDCDALEWSVPNWAKIGDIVFFMHTKTSNSIISALRTELRNAPYRWNDEQRKILEDALDLGTDLYRKYGGKIFAIGRVTSQPGYDNFSDGDGDSSANHWRSNIYADVDDICVLQNPVDISEFNSFIYVSRQGSLTPVHGRDFDRLREVIEAKNSVPQYFREATATPIPLTKINHENWLVLSNDYRRSFMDEKQFRKFYVDYFLRTLGDRKTLYEECRCRRPDIADSFMDNIILFNGRYLTVEVKLDVANEVNLPGQVAKYCYNTEVYRDCHTDKPLDISKRYDSYVLIIDTFDLYLYSAEGDTIQHLCSLDDIKSTDDIMEFRKQLISQLN